MAKIPTAEEFLEKHNKGKGHLMLNREEFTDSMIEFAKLHVKAALEAASKKAELDITDHGALEQKDKNWKSDSYTYGEMEIYVDDKSILTAYPLNLIK